jgi:hypothetical protein
LTVAKELIVGEENKVAEVDVLEDYKHDKRADELFIEVEGDRLGSKPVLKPVVNVPVEVEEVGDNLH